MLNARRHRCGDHVLRSAVQFGDGFGAQRPKASMRRSLDSQASIETACAKCSTPEGIDAAITRLDEKTFGGACGCSTPEGIDAAITAQTNCTDPSNNRSAQRPKASMRRSRSLAVERIEHDRGTCSTPEGIDAAITRLAAHDFLPFLIPCSTPEGIDAAITHIPLGSVAD